MTLNRVIALKGTFDGSFQHDSVASCHKSKFFQTFMRGNKIEVLHWPGNSSDLNPIENLRHILKNCLANMNCTTTEQVIKSALQVWSHNDEVKNMCPALVKSI
ncbi:uncharacterized protein TNCV_190091 [Trichonephila clavipes]|nr:uncharacterized protein TNCV_190091 [Trichonephila clavipes]